MAEKQKAARAAIERPEAETEQKPKRKKDQTEAEAKEAAHQAMMHASFLEAQRRARGETRRTQLHLAGPGHSWRGVRLEDLDPSVRRKAEGDAAKIAGPDATLMELRNETLNQVLRRMVVQVTTEPVESLANGARWMDTPLAMLAQPGQWDKLFTARDTLALERIYNQRHEMSVQEVDLLAGKLLPVASED
jgi:hypothetical protein